jgi:hypothetical protein
MQYVSALLAVTGMLLSWSRATADEGDVPFWLSGQYASLAAVPPAPGRYLPTMFYYYNGDASGSKSLRREHNLREPRHRGAAPVRHPDIRSGVKLLGGQPLLSVTFGGGYNQTSADGSLSAAGTPTLNRSRSDEPSILRMPFSAWRRALRMLWLTRAPGCWRLPRPISTPAT